MIAKLTALLCRAMLLLASAGFAGAGLITCLRFPLPALVVAGALAWKRLRPRQEAGWVHGTARVADAQDLFKHRLIGGDEGLILGRAGFAVPPPRLAALRTLIGAPLGQSGTACRLFFAAFTGDRWSRRSIIRLRKYVHLVTFAPTGRGKGVACQIPNLLTHRGSCVVTDPQGMLAHTTAAFRARVFKHTVVVIDPYSTVPGLQVSHTYNPLDQIAPDSPHLIDQCRDLANALVVRTGNEHEPFFNDMAEMVLAIFIAFVCIHEQNQKSRNLQTVRDIVSNRNRYTKALARMQELNACGGMLKRLASQLAWLVDRELGAVMSSVQKHTSWMDSPAMAASLACSSFDPRDLKKAGRMTIYLCLPPERLVTLAPLMRLWVGGLIRAVASGGVDERETVLFLLDEAGHIGHIQALEDAVTLMRAYGIRLWFFFQSVGQLTKCFGERAGIFLDNIDTQQFFGLNAIESADMISRRIGDTTVFTESSQSGSSYSRPSGGIGGQSQPAQHSTSSSVTISQMGKRLFRAEEIIRFPEDLTVICHRNLPPILGRLVKYYESPEFRRCGLVSSQRLGLGGVLVSVLALVMSVVALVIAASVQPPAVAPPASYRAYQPYAGQRRPNRSRARDNYDGRPEAVLPFIQSFP